MPPSVAATTSDGASASPKRRLADLLSSRREADVTGLAGAARGWVAKDLVGSGRPARVLLAVTPGEEEADELARDLTFFLGRKGEPSPVVRVPADPVLPYDDLSPDRGLEMERLAALARLHLDGASVWAVVVSVRALARRMVPRAVFDLHADLLGKGVTVEREALAAKLVALGYARVPLVEDPGTFAVRGGIIDVWSPLDERPVRLELFGDEIESAKAFDPESQRTLGDVAEVVLCPAREALFTTEGKEAAKAAVRDAAERVNRPTSRVREVLDEGHARVAERDELRRERFALDRDALAEEVRVHVEHRARHHAPRERARRDHHRPHRRTVEVEPGQRREPLHLEAAVRRQVVVRQHRVCRDAHDGRGLALSAEEEGEVARQLVCLVLARCDGEEYPRGLAAPQEILRHPPARCASEAGDIGLATRGKEVGELAPGRCARAVGGRGGHGGRHLTEERCGKKRPPEREPSFAAPASPRSSHGYTVGLQ